MCVFNCVCVGVCGGESCCVCDGCPIGGVQHHWKVELLLILSNNDVHPAVTILCLWRWWGRGMSVRV